MYWQGFEGDADIAPSNRGAIWSRGDLRKLVWVVGVPGANGTHDQTHDVIVCSPIGRGVAAWDPSQRRVAWTPIEPGAVERWMRLNKVKVQKLGREWHRVMGLRPHPDRPWAPVEVIVGCVGGITREAWLDPDLTLAFKMEFL